MNALLFFSVSLVHLISLRPGEACVMCSEDLHADLTQAVVRSSDWMKQFYMKQTTTLFPYRAGSMFATLRLVGHRPQTLLSDFKNNKGDSIEETLKNYLDSVQKQPGGLSSIPTGQLALIIQGVISICQDPEDFHGYDLLSPLYSGFPLFKKTPSFNNYFQYSLAVIAFCNSGQQIPHNVIKKLIKGANIVFTTHLVDYDALILTALSCVSKSSMHRKIEEASKKLVQRLISLQNVTTGAFGNQYSTALAVEALQAAHVRQDDYLYSKALRNILTYQDEEGSFGSILANIQITPALLGQSLISLKNRPCPAEPSPTPHPKNINVRVQLVFNVTNLTRTEPAVSVNMPRGRNAKTALDLAGSQKPCYKATYKKFSFGHSITSICGIATDGAKKHYWMIYINARSAKYGVDGLKPEDGDIITFKYEKLSF